uniref:Uncharacterized protein n=1 Tax=Anopheles arabiensis TaxID=7173 RepID=A0A182HIG4_ANOAR
GLRARASCFRRIGPPKVPDPGLGRFTHCTLWRRAVQNGSAIISVWGGAVARHTHIHDRRQIQVPGAKSHDRFFSVLRASKVSASPNRNPASPVNQTPHLRSSRAAHVSSCSTTSLGLTRALTSPGPAMNEWNELLKAELLPPSGSFRADGDAPGSIKCAGLFQGSAAAPGDCGLYHRHPQK